MSERALRHRATLLLPRALDASHPNLTPTQRQPTQHPPQPGTNQDPSTDAYPPAVQTTERSAQGSANHPSAIQAKDLTIPSHGFILRKEAIDVRRKDHPSFNLYTLDRFHVTEDLSPF